MWAKAGGAVAGRKLGFWRRFAVSLVLPVLRVWTKRTWSGQANIPPAGGVIIVANHLSQFDPLVIAHYVFDLGRWPQFLAKASIWKVPVLGYLLTRTWQIPVQRGSVEAARSLDSLIEALHRGGSVIIYPEGTTTREPDLWPMRGKTGAARLALITGAPVIPVATDGAQAVLDPRTRKLSLGRRAPVRVTAGPPVDLSKWQGESPSRAVLDEMTEAMMTDIRDLLAGLRGDTPPPLYQPAPRRRSGPSAVAE
jgi:1-acyl-sn-glycerol-3-phosphate acyltransferase